MAADFPDWTTAPVALVQTTARVSVTVSELGDSGQVIAADPARDRVIVAVQVVAFGVDTQRIREVIAGTVGWGGSPPPNVVAAWAISPETPSDIPALDPGSSVVPAGQAVTWSATVMGGGGASTVRIAVTYYLAA